MPSPNGYITGVELDRIDRSWARGTFTYDLSAPPWAGQGNPGAFEFEILISTTATGPWNPAPLTSPATQCNTLPSNRVSIQTSDSTTLGVGGAGGVNPPLADTDYWVRILVHNPADAVVDDWVQGPFHTAPYPQMTCLVPTNITHTSATANLAISNTGRLNITPTCNQDVLVWDISTSPTGPWTSSSQELAADYTPSHDFPSLQAGTTYYYRVRISEQPGIGAGGEYLVTEPCQFTTLEDAVTTPTFNPQPCCDGAAEGAHTCTAPVQFCFTSSSTGPVDHPGRMYDLTLPINQGFAVQSLQVDSVTSPANITWAVDDPDGEAFRTELTTFIEGRIPAAAVVTITNPNAGLGQPCGAALPFQIHIECLRLDQSPPDLIELVYNAGRDMVINPAYNENPPLNPPVSQGNYGYRLLSRQDDPGPFPGFPPANDALCTSVANRGWETNDTGRTFEIWGQDVAGGVTPTPRGTPVQEITSDGPPAGQRSTIWQTFQAPTSGNFIIRVVHGGRDAGEQHRITLTPGDTNATQGPGAIIDDTSNPPSVYGNPWTQFQQTIPLVGGQIYTLALSTNNPVSGARGGLFTDMRAYLDVPDQRATATTDDETCVVTTQETVTSTLCQYWQPSCTDGVITDWTRVDTGLKLTNAQFWAQTPSPSCCLPEAAEAGEGGSTVANLIHSYLVCAEIGGVNQTAVRYVITDPSGGILVSQIIGADGTPVSPTSWRPGGCGGSQFMGDQVLCDAGAFDAGGRPVQFLRKFLQSVSSAGFPTVASHSDFTLDGAPYTIVGDARLCDPDRDREVVCWTQTSTGSQVHTGTIYWNTDFENVPGGPGWILLDQNQTPVLATEPGLTFVPCSSVDPVATTGLCLADGTPIAVVTRRDADNGTLSQEGWINLLTGAFSAGNPPVGTESCSRAQSIQVSGTFCSVDTATNDVLALVLIEYTYAPDGSIASVRLVNATTGATYTVPAGAEITVCPTGGEQSADRDITVLCDTNGTVVTPFVRDYQRNNLGQITGHTDYTLANAPYTPTGVVGFCTPNTRDSESLILCDVVAGTPIPFMRTQVRDPNGVVTATIDTTPGGAPYTVTGTVAACTELDAETVTLCDAGNAPGGVPHPYILRLTFNATSGLLVGSSTLNLDGSAYTVVGPSVVCDSSVSDAEQQILCDSAAPTPNRFLRSYRYNANGTVAGFTDTTLAGAAFVPTGAVGVCATTVQADTDFVEEVMTDANGTCFIRLFRFNSVTGALVSTTNTTLAGAAFTPVGTVTAGCGTCCPEPIGSGCTNTGSGFYTAIRASNGTVTLIDSVSGATVTAGSIIPCPAESVAPTSVTLTAQGRLVADADAAWTPGTDVAGTLTSVTLTVLSGTATVTDQSGTVMAGLPAGYTATWTAEDHSALSGPQSIDAIGGQTAIVWTQK